MELGRKTFCTACPLFIIKGYYISKLRVPTSTSTPDFHRPSSSRPSSRASAVRSAASFARCAAAFASAASFAAIFANRK